MPSADLSSSQQTAYAGSKYILDPLINMDHVKWAARRFILVYGDEAPEKAKKHVTELDAKGKIQTAEMFACVQRECARLLKRSEKLRDFSIN